MIGEIELIAVFAKCKVVAGKENEFTRLALALAEKSRQESANVSYDILSEFDNTTNEFYFLEKWTDKAGLDAHMATEHFKETIAAVQKITEGDLEIHVYQTL